MAYLRTGPPAQAAARLSEHRQAALGAKRLKLDECALEGRAMDDGEAGTAQPDHAGAAADVARLAGAGPVGSRAFLHALRALRRRLSAPGDLPLGETVAAGAVPLLVRALQPPQGGPIATQTVLEAAWAATNLAAGPGAAARAVAAALPPLTALLPSADRELAEQLAWAMGNLAADGRELRRRLVAAGVVPLLARRVVESAAMFCGEEAGDGVGGGQEPAGGNGQECTAAAVAAWALGRTLQDAESAPVQALLCPGPTSLGLALVRLVRLAPPALATEAAWLLACCASAPDPGPGWVAMLDEGLLEAACARLRCAVAGGVATRRRPAGALAQALLRTLGHMVAAGDAARLRPLLMEEGRGTLHALCSCVESVDQGLRGEAAWTLGNLAGLPGREGAEAVAQAGAVQVRLRLVKAAGGLPGHLWAWASRCAVPEAGCCSAARWMALGNKLPASRLRCRAPPSPSLPQTRRCCVPWGGAVHSPSGTPSCMPWPTCARAGGTGAATLLRSSGC